MGCGGWQRGGAAYRRLSESPLWAVQRGFYERAGIEAWRTATVPHHVTSNVVLATAYARVVLAFLRDTGGREPLYVVELGAGSGRFAFLLLRALEAMQRRAPVRYVMTDIANATIDFWRRHEAFAPFLRTGRLDLARFDAERDRGLRLEAERRTIAPGAPAARIVVIANYVFGGLRQDAFAVGAGGMREYLVAARSRRNGSAADLPLAWRMGARATAPYAEDELNAILADYTKINAGGRLLFPVGALRCLDRFTALARDGLLVLAADRGTTKAADAVTDAVDLEAARHGAVSFPVSFHALRAWLARRGGEPLRPPRAHRHLHVAGFLLGPRVRAWRETRRTYETALARGGPDERYGTRRALATAEPRSPRALLSLIRRCGPDPRVLAECIRPLWPHLIGADARRRREIRDAVLAAWPNYLHLGEPYDVPFNFALVLYQVRAYADARALFGESLRLYGNDAATHWNIGLCHVALGKPQEAQASFRHARRLAPDLRPVGLATVTMRAKALAWLAKGKTSPALESP
jgi:tetratricopeptide (TPR) repeat protein